MNRKTQLLAKANVSLLSRPFFQLHSNMDKDDGNVKYVLTGEGAGNLFIIDEKSGDIHATKRLDREEKAMYTLHAKVIDRRTNREMEADTEFNIKIHDINDNEPKFAKEIFFASVPEMSEVGECGGEDGVLVRLAGGPRAKGSSVSKGVMFLCAVKLTFSLTCQKVG